MCIDLNPVHVCVLLLFLSSSFRPGSEAMYHFSEFTCSLNEMEEGVAPTDSRHRPDQRIMERGDFDEANRVKVRERERERKLLDVTRIHVIYFHFHH